MSGVVTARRAGGADVPAMFRIYSENLDGYFAPESLEFFMLQWPEGQFLAVDLLGEPVGALSGYLMEGGVASVALLAVDRDRRNLGAGTALMDAVTFEAVGAGATRMQLEARVTNATAIAFYEHRGFRRTEVLPGFYNDGGDAVRLVLDLDRAGEGRTPPPRPL